MSKTNLGLIAYAQAQIGNPYWMGTFGQISSAALYTSNKARLPQYYTAHDFYSQYSKRVHDCIGLIKGYLWSDTPTSVPVYCASPCTQDHSADSMYKACKTSGLIGTLPETPGALLFVKEGATMGHVGVYIGNGQAIEAKGHAWGVVQTAVSGRGWTHWGICPYIEYEAIESEDEMAKVIDQIAANCKCTTDEAVMKLSVLCSMVNESVEPYETEGVAYLKNAGIINSNHDPREPISYGTYGLMVQREKK